MGYKFKCGECGHELVVKWLKPGETAKCHDCGAETKVPVNAAEVGNDYAPLPGKETGGARENPDPGTSSNCPTCRYLETLDRAKTEIFAGDIAGLCHRYPPSVEGVYPPVTPADWCGEHCKKE